MANRIRREVTAVGEGAVLRRTDLPSASGRWRARRDLRRRLAEARRRRRPGSTVSRGPASSWPTDDSGWSLPPANPAPSAFSISRIRTRPGSSRSRTSRATPSGPSSARPPMTLGESRSRRATTSRRKRSRVRRSSSRPTGARRRAAARKRASSAGSGSTPFYLETVLDAPAGTAVPRRRADRNGFAPPARRSALRAGRQRRRPHLLDRFRGGLEHPPRRLSHVAGDRVRPRRFDRAQRQPAHARHAGRRPRRLLGRASDPSRAIRSAISRAPSTDGRVHPEAPGGDRRKQRIQSELAIARTIQHKLLPPPEATRPGFSVLAHFQPVAEIGGDYYDYIEMPDGRTAVALGDVSGHGLPTGLLVAMAKAALVDAARGRPLRSASSSAD